MRKSKFSGSFYSGDFGELDKQIKDSFTGKLGPGNLPEERCNNKIKAVIVPHAGYFFSGQCMAHGYKKISESKMPEVYIVLGTNHQDKNNYISLQDFQTPFGVVKNDIKLSRELGLEVNNSIHESEHSIEVQIPFLQFASKNSLAKLRIVPILVGNCNDELIKKLKNISKEVVFIVSSDLNHVGNNYGFFGDIDTLDKEIINLIELGNMEKIKEYFSKDNTVCGSQPILTVLCMLQTKGQLLKYYNSSEISDEESNKVGYCSMLFD